MKLGSWTLLALMLAAAGCGDETRDGTEYGGNAGFDIDGGGAGNGGASAGGPGATGANGGSGVSASAGSNDGKCDEYTVRNEQVTPDILIVLDRSSSMNTDGNNSSSDRWTGSRNAIIASTNTYNTQISFGLMVFPDDGTCGSTKVAVPIKANSAADIKTMLGSMKAQGSTPTLTALKRAHQEIGKGSIAIDGIAKPKVVLLVTDGAPNCAGGAAPPECVPGPTFNFVKCLTAGASTAGDAGLVRDIVAELTAMSGEGTRTFVIGYETAGTAFAGNLDMMAAAGGTALKTHTSVASEQQLNEVLQSMIGNAVSCTYGLEKAPPNASHVLVSVDGEQLNLDQPDGWKLGADGKSVEVQGKACEKLQSGAGQHTLNVQVKCDVVPII